MKHQTYARVMKINDSLEKEHHGLNQAKMQLPVERANDYTNSTSVLGTCAHSN